MNQNHIYKLEIIWSEPKYEEQTIILKPKKFLNNYGEIKF